jgi:hypothetical protein
MKIHSLNLHWNFPICPSWVTAGGFFIFRGILNTPVEELNMEHQEIQLRADELLDELTDYDKKGDLSDLDVRFIARDGKEFKISRVEIDPGKGEFTLHELIESFSDNTDRHGSGFSFTPELPESFIEVFKERTPEDKAKIREENATKPVSIDSYKKMRELEEFL